jgi:hypothetical protein
MYDWDQDSDVHSAVLEDLTSHTVTGWTITLGR